MPAWLRTIGVLDGVLVVLGVVLLIAGVLVMRVRWRRPADAFVEDGGQASPSTVSAGALALLVLGYHCLAWGLPDHWIPMRVPESLWWVVVAVGAIAFGASWMIDRSEARWLSRGQGEDAAEDFEDEPEDDDGAPGERSRRPV